MILNKVLHYPFAPLEHTLSEKDCMLYALGIGLGADPIDPRQLPFVYEKGLKILPSQAVVVAHPGNWHTDPALDINWVELLHAEQMVIQHAPLQPGNTYVGHCKVLGVVDKGSDKGALLYQQRILTDKKVAVG